MTSTTAFLERLRRESPRLAALAEKYPDPETVQALLDGHDATIARRRETEHAGYRAQEKRRQAQERANPLEESQRRVSWPVGAPRATLNQLETPQEAPGDENKAQAGQGPAHIKVWPLLGFTAKREKLGGAWRLWTMALNFDEPGAGWVDADEFRAHVLAQVSATRPDGTKLTAAKMYSRWFDSAVGSGLLRMTTPRHSDAKRIYYLSQEKTVELLQPASVARRPVEIKVRRFLALGWLAWVWAAFIKLHENKPISRVRQEELTGVPERTQYEYEEFAGVVRQPNYAVSNLPESHLPGVKDNGRSHAFVFKSKNQSAGSIAWRIPDSRGAPVGVRTHAHKGRSRKMRNALKSNLSQSRQVPRKVVRLFFDESTKQKSVDRAAKQLHTDPDVSEFYRRRPLAASQNKHLATTPSTWSVHDVEEIRL